MKYNTNIETITEAEDGSVLVNGEEVRLSDVVEGSSDTKLIARLLHLANEGEPLRMYIMAKIGKVDSVTLIELVIWLLEDMTYKQLLDITNLKEAVDEV